MPKVREEQKHLAKMSSFWWKDSYISTIWFSPFQWIKTTDSIYLNVIFVTLSSSFWRRDFEVGKFSSSSSSDSDIHASSSTTFESGRFIVKTIQFISMYIISLWRSEDKIQALWEYIAQAILVPLLAPKCTLGMSYIFPFHTKILVNLPSMKIILEYHSKTSFY